MMPARAPPTIRTASANLLTRLIVARCTVAGAALSGRRDEWGPLSNGPRSGIRKVMLEFSLLSICEAGVVVDAAARPPLQPVASGCRQRYRAFRGKRRPQLLPLPR